MARGFRLVWALEVPAHRRMSGPGGHVGEYDHRNDVHPAAELAVDGVTEAEGGLQRERQRRIPAPQTVVGAEMPLPLVVHGVLTAPDLEGWVSQGA